MTTLPALTARLAATMQRERQQMAGIIDAMLPPLEAIPGPGVALQARRNAEARVALAAEFGLLKAAEVAASAGSRASNSSATATRWRGQGRIFPVLYRGTQTYPGFEFDDQGQPRAAIAAVLKAVADAVTGWELALWFVSNNGWLDGARPVDQLDTDPESVVQAAAQVAAGPPV